MTSSDTVDAATHPPRSDPPDSERLKREFYLAVFDAAERILLPVAEDIDGLDQEIAVLRLKLREMLKPKDSSETGEQQDTTKEVKLVLRAMDMLNRLVGTRYRISKKSQRDLAENMANVLQAVRAELGIGEDSGPGA